MKKVAFAAALALTATTAANAGGYSAPEVDSSPVVTTITDNPSSSLSGTPLYLLIGAVTVATIAAVN